MTAPARAKKSASRSGSGERAQSAAKKTTAKKTTQTKTTAKSATKTDKPRSRSAAAERAYARREERRERSTREPSVRRPRQVRTGSEDRRPTTAKPKTRAKQLQERVSFARLPLVVMVMSVLAVGLAATLWLSIAAVSGSYQLQRGEAEIAQLNERRERLLREVSSLDSPPAIQRRATEDLGMVPGPTPAHLVMQPDGTVLVIGEPEKASAPPPPAPPAPPAGEQPSAEQPPEVAAEGR
ncbi:FtsB family cell division protein [Saccharopolyspora sp. NPDC002376]